ncbi:MAG: MspA family porin [Gordonia sp. (in: high G+C Gram-positive bacteria)]|uniref:MspA family porin n=1 Tax=Gordonia sp. (in: high G+C Gram-positive bacteria) TaxID=84139 RepID=UPI003BB639AB
MGQMRRIAAIALTAVTGVAALGLGAGSAEAAKLPGGSYSRSIPGGGKVSIRLTDEYVRHVGSVANSHFSREVWVSGKVRVATSGPVKGGTVTAGYLVGCQLEFGATAGVDGGLTTDDDDVLKTPEIQIPGGPTIKSQPTIINKDSGSSAGFSIAPGQAVFQPVVNVKVDGETVNGFTFTNPKGGVAYSQERFSVEGCAGFAQARALVNVRVSSAEFRGNVTMYGKPFSIG